VCLDIWITSSSTNPILKNTKGQQPITVVTARRRALLNSAIPEIPRSCHLGHQPVKNWTFPTVTLPQEPTGSSDKPFLATVSQFPDGHLTSCSGHAPCRAKPVPITAQHELSAELTAATTPSLGS